MNQKERLEAIREKHQKEREKRKLLIRRITLAAATAAIIICTIFLVRGCILSISRHIAEKRQAEALQVTPTTEVESESVIDENGIDQTYFSSSAFVGNSFIEGISIYNLVNGANYFSKVGLNVNDAMTQTVQNGTVPVIDELKNDKKYSKIFMMFGENELGWVSSDSFAEQYGLLIEKAREYQPQAKIYLLAITPVTKKISEENHDNTNNESIMLYNDIIKQLAENNNAVYADIYSAVVDKDGNLPEGAAGDGIHFGKEYYIKCLIYIQNNLQ